MTTSPIAGLLIALALAACENDRTPPPSPTPSEPPREAKAAAVPEDDCRDWSTLDVTQLPELTEGKHAPLLDAVWRRVFEKHFDPTLGCLPWDRLRAEYAGKIAEAATDREAYAQINALLDELGQSHLRLFPPDRAPDSPGPASPDLTVRWIEDQLVVVRSQATGPQGSVLPGAVLHAINDRPVAPLIEQVRGRSEPHAFALEIARAVAVRLSCSKAGDSRKLKVTNPAKDGRMAVRIVPCVEPEGERVTLGNLRDVPTHVEHRMLEGEGEGEGGGEADRTIGLMTFNVWMLPMVKRVQAGIKELRAQGMRGLIFDLRGNPGGVGAMSVPVARLLLDEETSLGTLTFRDFPQTFNVEPGEDPFMGPVVVLVDEGTASTSEIFIRGLRDHERITVVGGRPSAGAALPSVIEQMPGGALLQYVVADYRSPKGTPVEGRGIAPDILVTETRAAFEAGRDPVLEAAQAHLARVIAKLPVGEPDSSAGSERTGGTGEPAPAVPTRDDVADPTAVETPKQAPEQSPKKAP